MHLLTNGGESFLSHPHMLRYACGFALADQGADTRLIQDCLGNRGATLPLMSDLGKVLRSNYRGEALFASAV